MTTNCFISLDFDKLTPPELLQIVMTADKSTAEYTSCYISKVNYIYIVMF